jgi:hypothetical protein
VGSTRESVVPTKSPARLGCGTSANQL